MVLEIQKKSKHVWNICESVFSFIWIVILSYDHIFESHFWYYKKNIDITLSNLQILYQKHFQM